MAKEQILQAQHLVYEYQQRLHDESLAPLNWGNCSVYLRDIDCVVIKPSGVRPEKVKPEDMSVLRLDGKIISGFKASSDLETHLELYRHFPEINAVIHTHSKYATLFAQAQVPIPCLGTTHADVFKGEVPVTRVLLQSEVENHYEKETGALIVEHLHDNQISPLESPAILVACHGPFVWGADLESAFQAAFTLEYVAEMAIHMQQLGGGRSSIPHYLSEKHFNRKHGVNAYYGQEKEAKLKA